MENNGQMFVNFDEFSEKEIEAFIYAADSALKRRQETRKNKLRQAIIDAINNADADGYDVRADYQGGSIYLAARDVIITLE